MVGGISLFVPVCAVGLFLVTIVELTGLQYTRMRTIWNSNTPDLAVDNDTASCAVSGFDTGPWWWMDLGQPQLVSGLILLGTLDSFNIRVGNMTDSLGSQDGFDTNALCEFSLPVNLLTETAFPCRQKIVGRYVSIQLADPLTITQLRLCNVTVI